MRLFLLTTMAIGLAACTSSSAQWVVLPATADTAGTNVTIIGTVRYTEIEGGAYTIKTDDGVTYDPTNLPAEFKKDGLAVEAEGRKDVNMVGIRQVGPIVTLTRIRLRT